MKSISKVSIAAALLVVSLAACKAKSTSNTLQAGSTSTDSSANSTADALPPDPLAGLPTVSGVQFALPALPDYNAAAFAAPAAGDLQAIPKPDSFDVAIYDAQANDRCAQAYSADGTSNNYVPGMIIKCDSPIPANAAASDAASKAPYTVEITYYDADSNIIGNFDGQMMVAPNQQSWDAIPMTVNDAYVVISKYFTAGAAASISISPSAGSPAGAAAAAAAGAAVGGAVSQ